MKYTITYEHGTSDWPIQATVKIDDNNFAVGSGRSIDEAKANVIERVKVKLIELPPSEEVEI